MPERAWSKQPPPQGPRSISPMIILPPVIIAVVMSLLLAVVNSFTEEPIAAARLADKRDKLEEVMPTFSNDPLASEYPLSETPMGKPGNVMRYTGEQDEQVSGYGITSAVGTGYSGYFSVVFGLRPDGTIEKVRILESMETPGLGSKAAEPQFIDQFNGLDPETLVIAVTKDGGEVDAITGATITSRAVCDAVVQGLEAWHNDMSENRPAEDSCAKEELSGEN